MLIEKEPVDLLTHDRVDVIAKYAYLKFKELNIKSKWAAELYESHLKVWNNLHEGAPLKNGIQDYITTFDVMSESIKNNTFDFKNSPVDIDRTHKLLNGSHRVAACLFHNKKCLCQISPPDKGQLNCGWSYFKTRSQFVKTGLLDKYLDYMATEYAKLKDNVYVATVFPSTQGESEDFIRSIFKKYDCYIVYFKTIKLNELGLFNLVKQMYHGEQWIGGWHNGFSGSRSKARLCWGPAGITRTYLIECSIESNLDKCKQEIRAHFKIQNHSMHINNTKEETLKLTGALFNKNSIHFLNHAKEENYKKFYGFFRQYKQWLTNQGRDNFCVDASSVLSAYGLREGRDLDFLHFGADIKSNMADINCHNKDAQHYTTNVDDIIFNPDNYFYYDGFKFASLGIIKKMKEARNEPKDVVDVNLINGLNHD